MEELQEHTRPHTSEWLRKGLKVKVRQSVSAKLVWVARNNRQQQRGKAEADQKQREPTHGAGELLIWLIDVPSAVHIVKSLTDCETHKESPFRFTHPIVHCSRQLGKQSPDKVYFLQQTMNMYRMRPTGTCQSLSFWGSLSALVVSSFYLETQYTVPNIFYSRLRHFGNWNIIQLVLLRVDECIFSMHRW